jgi:hypothetical protein
MIALTRNSFSRNFKTMSIFFSFCLIIPEFFWVCWQNVTNFLTWAKSSKNPLSFYFLLSAKALKNLSLVIQAKLTNPLIKCLCLNISMSVFLNSFFVKLPDPLCLLLQNLWFQSVNCHINCFWSHNFAHRVDLIWIFFEFLF